MIQNIITTSLRKHLSLKNNFLLLLIFSAVIFAGCGKEEQKNNVVAKVNDSYLTEEELALIAGSSSNLFKEELIRHWINRELLYQKAVDEGIVNKDEYNRILEQSKKELAGSLLLKKKYDEYELTVNEQEIEPFYIENIKEFELGFNAFLINKITFNDEQQALKFRNMVIESNWNKALNVYKGDLSVVSGNTGIFLYEYEIEPGDFIRIAKEMNPQEVSIVLENPEGNFVLIQVLEKFNAGTIPSYEFIKGRVKKRFLNSKKEEFIKEYIRNLYSQNDIEVKK